MTFRRQTHILAASGRWLTGVHSTIRYRGRVNTRNWNLNSESISDPPGCLTPDDESIPANVGAESLERKAKTKIRITPSPIVYLLIVKSSLIYRFGVSGFSSSSPSPPVVACGPMSVNFFHRRSKIVTSPWNDRLRLVYRVLKTLFTGYSAFEKIDWRLRKGKIDRILTVDVTQQLENVVAAELHGDVERRVALRTNGKLLASFISLQHPFCWRTM